MQIAKISSQIGFAVLLYPIIATLDWLGIKNNPWILGCCVGVIASWVVIAFLVQWNGRPRWITWIVPVPVIRSAGDGQLRTMLTSGTWIICHNMDRGSYKELTFLSDGGVGKNKDSFQASWTLCGPMLVMKRDDGTVNNRFLWNESSRRFDSTDEKESRTVGEMRVTGQYIEPGATA